MIRKPRSRLPDAGRLRSELYPPRLVEILEDTDCLPDSGAGWADLSPTSRPGQGPRPPAKPPRPSKPKRVRPCSRVDVEAWDRLRDAVAGAQAAGYPLRVEEALSLACTAAAISLELAHNAGQRFPPRADDLPAGRMRKHREMPAPAKPRA